MNKSKHKEKNKNKVVKTLVTLTAALMFTTAWTSVAHAEPITILLFGSTFASTFVGGIVSALIGSLVTWGISTLAGMLFGDEEDDEGTTQQYGERVYRQGIFGTIPVDTHLMHMNEYNDSKTLHMAIGLADGQITDLVGCRVNGKLYSLTAAANSNNSHKAYTVDEFEGKLKLRLHDGRVGQAADTSLVSHTSGWDSSKKFSSIAYVVAELESDSDLFSGIPSVEPIPKGFVCYDRRKDGSLPGGTGTHRFNDPSTWEYSENNGVHAYHFTRGFYFNGIRVLGAGYPEARLDLESFITAMNVCDEVVVRPDTTERPRYTNHMSFSDAEQFGSVMDKICQGMGGFWCERGGKVSIFAGTAQTSVITFTDGDLVRDSDLEFDQKRPGESLYMGIQGTYTNSQDWEAAAYDPELTLIPSSFQLDNTETRILEYNLSQVQDAHQAFLVAKQILYAIQTQATLSCTVDIKNVLVEVGDWVRFVSDVSAIGDRFYQVKGVVTDFTTMRMALSLEETSVDVFDDDATADDIVEQQRNPEIGSYVDSVEILSVEPIALIGTTGSQIPGLEVTYTAIDDPAVYAVDFEYYAIAEGALPQGPMMKYTDHTPADGVCVIDTGVVAGRTYTVHGYPNSIPGRAVSWGDWEEASGPTPSLIADEAVSGGVPPSVDSLLATLGEETRALREAVAAHQLRVLDLSSFQSSRITELRRELADAINENTAAWSEVVSIAVSETGVIAQRVEQVEVKFLEYATVTAMNALDVRVTDTEDGLVLQGSEITVLEAALTGYLGSNAVSTAFSGLNVQVSDIEGDITVLASDITTLEATLGDVTAGGFVKFEVVVAESGWDATYQIAVYGEDDDVFVGAGLRINVDDDGTSEIVLESDKTVIKTAAGTILALFKEDGVYFNLDRVKDLDVDTEKLNDNAVSNTAAAFTRGSINLNSTDSVNVDVQSIAMTVPVSGPMSVQGSFVTFLTSIPSGYYLIIEIVRDSTVIHYSIQKIDTNWEHGHGFNVAYIDSPSAGSYTYKLRLSTSNGANTSKENLVGSDEVDVQERYLEATLLKK